MEIFELAEKLGEALKNDARLVAFSAAKEAYEKDDDLRRMTTEYEVQQRAMQDEIAKPDRDMHLVEAIQSRIDELYRGIAEHPAFRELNRTQKEVNDLMNQVNRTIMTTITGENPACTHDCSTCGGCH